MKERKVMVIGLDGGTWKVFDRLIKDEFMPNLKELKENNSNGALESTKPPISPVAWSSFMTGVNPGKHGIYGFSFFDRNSQTTSVVNSTSLKVPTLWDYLSYHNKQSIVLNVPMTYPVRPIKGSLITGLLTPSSDSNFIFPGTLREELNNNIPDGWKFLEHSSTFNPHGDFEGFLNEMVEFVKNRTEVALYIMEKEWDFFMIHFQCLDFLQHPFWKYLDPSHPDYDDRKYQTIAKKFFAKLDKAISVIVSKAESIQKNIATVIMSDHGFQSHIKSVDLNGLLHKHGWLKLKRNRKTKNKFFNLLRRLDVFEWRKKILPVEKQKKMMKEHLNEIIDYENSDAFAVSSFWGLVYLNSKQDANRDDMRQKLETELKGFYKNIYFKDEIYEGNSLSEFPDIIIEPSDGITFHTNSRFNGQELECLIDTRSDFHVGTHALNGIYLIKSPEQIVKDNSKLVISDIFSIVASYLNIEVGGYVDSNYLKEELRIEGLSLKNGVEEYDMNRYEKNKIMNNLKGLGYM